MSIEALMELGTPARLDGTPADLADPARLEDARLIRAFREGDATAFESLYRRLRGRVFGLAVRLTGSRTEGEEMTQEVFVRAWEHRRKIESVLHFERWLRGVTIHRWINALRRHDPEPPDDEQAIERVGTPAGSPAARVDLERAIAALPPRLRAVLLLFDLYGLSHQEVADHLDITVGASKVQLHRARRRLQESLQ